LKGKSPDILTFTRYSSVTLCKDFRHITNSLTVKFVRKKSSAFQFFHVQPEENFTYDIFTFTVQSRSGHGPVSIRPLSRKYFLSVVADVFTLLERYAASVDSFLPTYRDSLTNVIIKGQVVEKE